MTRRTKLIGVVVALLAMISFGAWPLWKWLMLKPVNIALYERAKALVDKNPNLKPDWDKALADNVLTLDEATVIVEKAGEKVGPEESK